MLAPSTRLLLTSASLPLGMSLDPPATGCDPSIDVFNPSDCCVVIESLLFRILLSVRASGDPPIVGRWRGDWVAESELLSAAQSVASLSNSSASVSRMVCCLVRSLLLPRVHRCCRIVRNRIEIDSRIEFYANKRPAFIFTFNVLKNPCVRCNTPDTDGLIAPLALALSRCGDSMSLSRGVAFVPSRLSSSDADLLICFTYFGAASKLSF